MKFTNIDMLFLIWAIPLLLLIYGYGMKRRRKILKSFAQQRGLQAILPGIGSGRRWTKATLVLVSLLLIAFSLAGPQYGYRWEEIEQKGIDIIVALDCSRSMLASDIRPTRLDRAKREIFDLLTMLQGDRIGLVAFAGTAFLQCPLTLDYDAFYLFLNTLTPDYLPVGGTDILGAVRVSTAAFDSKANTEKAIIIITDGENTGDGNPLEAADEAKKTGIKIFCIGVGSVEGVPVPDNQSGFKKDASGKIVVTRLDEDTLRKIAVLTGGTYVQSIAGDMDLDVIYKQEIREKMETSTVASGKKKVWEDRYQWVLLFAIIGLFIELCLPAFRKRSISMMIFLMLCIAPPALHAGPIHEGMEAYQKGEYDTALKQFIDAQLENPDHPEILYNIANTHYKLGNYDEAIDHYFQAMKTEDRALKEKILYNLGNAQFKKQKYEEAIKHYQSALTIDPNDLQAKQNIEFVKKVIEEQKKQQQEGGQCNKDSEDSKESEDQQESKNSEGQQDPEESQEPSQKTSQKKSDDQQEKNAEQSENDESQKSPDFGKEMSDEQQKNEQTQTAQGQKSDEEKENGDKGSAMSQAQPADPSEDAEQKKQTERVLNRLIDQPGRAMIPQYGKQHVEKDW